MNKLRIAGILALAVLSVAGLRQAAWAQVGQSALGPPTGLVGNSLGRLALGDGPGWFYYGLNAADRGLGYNGSYMTLGGFIPYGEDDLGGLWAADLRGHLSEYGGFFSNVGAVRKQFIGGTLFGIGVYWDYDADLNQYPVWGQPGTETFGQFGHVYNQVGISTEWLTDYGNLRSNGYLPVGTTAYTVGAPGYDFVGNNLLCQYGLDSALTGADLEVGAYIPGLTDWAGMISVGGYALGNSRYDWQQGTQAGQEVVPWFGGVYTRLDMTFVDNWDFSLQANNDSYFDWTGFARLTYRMGGSRRRNVPDQVEQPMMRNEHIVRAHQTPIVAINPVTNQAWNVVHVDNTAAANGTGSVTAPVRTLAAGQALATNPYDIVYVHAGTSASQPYESVWNFQADNQILVGQGSTLQLNTASCGYRQFFNTLPATSYPVLTSSGTAITLRNGAIVDHLRVQNAPVGIAANAAMAGTANVNDVQLVGTGTPGDVGVQLSSLPAGAKVNLFNMNLQDMNRALVIDAGAADIEFQGLITNTTSPTPSLEIVGTTGGTINVNRTTSTLQTPVARNQTFVAAYGIVDTNSQSAAAITIDSTANTNVNVGQARIVAPTQPGVLVTNNTGSQVRFTDLRVESAVAEAFETLSNDAATRVEISGPGSRLASASTTTAAFASNDAAILEITLASLKSAVPVGTNAAIDLQGTSTGFFMITEEFLVGDTPGTPGTVAADVTNTTTGPVVVTVP
jgi:hypothetical protein